MDIILSNSTALLIFMTLLLMNCDVRLALPLKEIDSEAIFEKYAEYEIDNGRSIKFSSNI